MRVPSPDQERAAREDDARRHLTDAGAAELPRAPWLHRSQPLSSVDLVRYAVWRGQSGTVTADDVEAALTLLAAARTEVEQLETATVFLARAEGMSWSRIARASGLGSAQAALQRFDRLAARTESRRDP